MSQAICADQCRAEVEELHAFFQAWLDGSLPNSDAVFSRFTAVTDPAFTLISPAGQVEDAAAAAQWIYAARGTRPGVRLWTDQHTLRCADERTAVVTYREWQTNAGVTTLRLSTAVLAADPAAPNGLRWLHVHETWLPLPEVAP